MDTEAAGQLVMEALAHAVAGDADRAATTMMTLGQQSDASRMYGVCCALANTGAMMLRRFYGDRAPRPGTADMWVMEQLKPGALHDDPAEAFAVRFLIAYANGDTDTCLALYDAAWKASDGDYVSSMGALLANVAGVTRLALGQQGGDRK